MATTTRTMSRRASSRDEEPTRGRRSRRDDVDDEQEPTRGRRSRRDDIDDDYADEEPPRRGRRNRDEDDSRDADEAPSRGRRSSRRDEDAEERPSRRGRRSDSSEDRAPRRGGRRSGDSDRRERPKVTGSGWGSFSQKRASRSGGDWADEYKPYDDRSLIKILDDEPFSVFRQHWINDLPQGVKKSYVCLEDAGCPLCDIGERASTYALFNIVDLVDPEKPEVKVWKVSQTVADVLEEYAGEKKTSPLNRDDLYWSVWLTGRGKKGRSTVHVTPVKERDLEEDWDTLPFTPEEIDEFELFDEEKALFINDRESLEDLVEEHNL